MSIRLIDSNGLAFDQQNLVLLHPSTDKGHNQSTKLDSLTANLLSCFLDNPDIVLSREQLVKKVWSSQHTSDNAVNRCVSVLRKALGPNDKQYISTISKVGYRFNAHIKPEPPASPAPQKTATCESAALFTTAIPAPITTLVTPANSATLTQTHQTQRLTLLGSLVLLFAIAMVTAIAKSSTFGAGQTVTQEVIHDVSKTQSNNVLTISAQPFVDLSEQTQQRHFIKGLDAQMLNHLTRISGLVVFKHGIKSTLNATRNVDYQLQGSVDKSGDTVRITAQLIETATGTYLFSTSFDRQLTNVFDIQEKVAEQVAAALKLSLIYKDHQYSSALTRLDHLAVEALLIARAKLNEHTTASVTQALESLKSLNQRFKDTPEVMGLLAKAWQELVQRPQVVADYRPENAITLAKKTLALQPNNLDALKALYYYYARYPEHREQSFALSETIVQYHPGQASAWRSQLHQMLSSARPCNQIGDYVDSIPKGVFTKHRLTAIQGILNHCLHATPLKTALNFDTAIKQRYFKQAIYKNLYFFAMPNDILFEVLKERHFRSPRTQNTLNYYWAQLALGANKAAAVTAKTINQSHNSYADSQKMAYDSLYGINNPNTLLAVEQPINNNFNTFYYSAALIDASKRSGDTRKLKDWLATKTTFPITLINRNAAIELMMLQYHTKQYEQSQLTAKALFDLLSTYYQQHRASYLFWGLGGKHLIAKMYCGEPCNTLGVMPLEQWFKPGHAWWVDDIATTRLALSPFIQTPVVVDYLNRIELDRNRVRQKFGLM